MSLEIHALHVGTLPSFPMAAVTYQRGHGRTFDVTIIMFVITGGDHPIVVDTGTASESAALAQHGITLERPPEQEPLAALARIGVQPADVRTVINTHLHWDHSSNNDLFPNARIVVQKSELEYAIDPLEPNCKTYERGPGMQPSWLKALDRIDTVEGDVCVAPGVRVVHVPGHTPGSQGVLVSAASDKYFIAGDCVTSHANWDGDPGLSHIPAASFTNLHDFMASFKKIEDLGCVVIPSHDPRVVEVGLFA